MGGQGLVTIFDIYIYIYIGFRVCGIQPLNLLAIVGKFGPSEMFIATKEDDHENSYQSNATNESSNNGHEIEVVT